ncbi:MAG: EamA family transporter RarD [Terrimesophilobacter sp.]
MDLQGRKTQLGVSVSIASSMVFSVVFVYSAYLNFSANVLFGWRVTFTVIMLAAFLTLTRRWRVLRILARRIAQRPVRGLALLLTAAIVGTQIWLFTWAPAAGRGLPVALGYFILPIVLAFIGRVVFRERLGPWRTASVIIAVLAVIYQFWQVGGVAWETAVVAIGYPIYFMVRRLAGIGGSSGLTAEMMLVMPVALILLVGDDPTLTTLTHPKFAFTLAGFGTLASIGLLLYIAASQFLPLSLFGLLSYLEPILLALAAALVLGEALNVTELATYLAIGLALLLLAAETFARARPPRNEPLVG